MEEKPAKEWLKVKSSEDIEGYKGATGYRGDLRMMDQTCRETRNTGRGREKLRIRVKRVNSKEEIEN